MSAADLAAYIGAAAWLPIVGAWIYRTFVTPKVIIVPGELPEIGFTSFGPIINLRMAITAQRKPVVIDSFSLVLTHENGEIREFHWVGMSEDVNQITDSAGNRQRIEKEHTAIALHVGVESLLEKLVRFHDRKFSATQFSVGEPLQQKIHHAVGQSNFSATDIEASQEFAELKRLWARSFPWKPGKYVGRFAIGSPSRCSLQDCSFEFILQDRDAENLRSNLSVLESHFCGLLKQIETNQLPPEQTWRWCYPRLRRIR